MGATGNYTASVVNESKPRAPRGKLPVRAWT
jgi:hypothetical protein